MSSPLPTHIDILSLTAYLPRLYANDLTLIEWVTKQGQFPYPNYAPVVKEFFRLAGKPIWSDYNYDPSQVGALIQDAEHLRTCELAEIKTLLTYCVRGERFADGHWAAMIEDGTIRQILERLVVLEKEM